MRNALLVAAGAGPPPRDVYRRARGRPEAITARSENTATAIRNRIANGCSMQTGGILMRIAMTLLALAFFGSQFVLELVLQRSG